MPFMAGDVKKLYDEIYQLVCNLHVKWKIYLQLYAHSEERVNFLNRCAPLFFGLFQIILWDGILLSLCKLTDPSKSNKGENLSISRLQESLKKEIDNDTLTVLCKIHSKLKKISEKYFLPHRNKRIAHLDLRVSFNEEAQLLPGISREMIEKTIAFIHNYLNTIEIYYDLGEASYKDIIVDNDAEDLIFLLEKGLEFINHLKSAKRIN